MNDQKQEENGNQLRHANICWWHESHDPSVTLNGLIHDAWSCVYNNYFDLPAYATGKFQSEKSLIFSDFEPSSLKTAAFYKILIT